VQLPRRSKYQFSAAVVLIDPSGNPDHSASQKLKITKSASIAREDDRGEIFPRKRSAKIKKRSTHRRPNLYHIPGHGGVFAKMTGRLLVRIDRPPKHASPTGQSKRTGKPVHNEWNSQNTEDRDIYPPPASRSDHTL